MIYLDVPYRRATPDDAAAMADLVNIASDNMASYVWSKLARPGQTGMALGRERARLGLGGFAFENTVVREVDGEVAACLIGWSKTAPPKPADAETPAILVPLVELGNLAPTSWYLNVLSTFPQHRRKGFATEFLRMADQFARDAGHDCINLTMTDANTNARRLYEANGYTKRATRPILKEDWQHTGRNWVLMVKDL